jgi:hypothetical protein
VYHEDRLQVQNRCMTVTGTVANVVHEDDGDIHVDLRLPPSEAQLLNEANMTSQYGQLVTEIVPADEPGCTPGKPPRPAHGSYNYGVCTGADISAPPVGARVVVVGPYVLDADHGWMEIHPVWAIKVPDTQATASDAGHSWSDVTDSSGSVTILLFNTPAGSTITVTVGAASCSTTAV